MFKRRRLRISYEEFERSTLKKIRECGARLQRSGLKMSHQTVKQVILNVPEQSCNQKRTEVKTDCDKRITLVDIRTSIEYTSNSIVTVKQPKAVEWVSTILSCQFKVRWETDLHRHARMFWQTIGQRYGGENSCLNRQEYPSVARSFPSSDRRVAILHCNGFRQISAKGWY